MVLDEELERMIFALALLEQQLGDFRSSLAEIEAEQETFKNYPPSAKEWVNLTCREFQVKEMIRLSLLAFAQLEKSIWDKLPKLTIQPPPRGR